MMNLKKFLKISLVIICFYSAAVYSSELLTDKLSVLKIKIDYVDKLSIALNKCGIDKNIVLSIIMIESSFVVDNYNTESHDYGLMQINEFHAKKLDKKLLLTDVGYNIEHGCNILRWFLNTYELNEAIMRYNVGTAKNAIKLDAAKNYLENFNKYYFKLIKN